MSGPVVLPGDVLQVGKLGAAIFSADGTRRRWLQRRISDAPRRCGFVMLNPSKAGADKTDPTITRCIGFATREGCGSLEVANVFDWIETESANLGIPAARGLMTDANSAHYVRHVLGCDVVIVAWGAHKLARGRLASMWPNDPTVTLGLRCLGKTKTGAPIHPLYRPANTPLELWP